MENVFEDLITTIERYSIDNKANISNVTLFAKSWREEFKIAKEQDNEDIIKKLEAIQEEFEQDEYDPKMLIHSVNNIINEWIESLKGEINNPNQTKTF